MTVILDTPEQIHAALLLSIRSTLAMECRGNGMRFSNRVNVFQQAKSVLTQHGIKPKGRKVAVWHQFNDLCDALGLPAYSRPHPTSA